MATSRPTRKRSSSLSDPELGVEDSARPSQRVKRIQDHGETDSASKRDDRMTGQACNLDSASVQHPNSFIAASLTTAPLHLQRSQQPVTLLTLPGGRGTPSREKEILILKTEIRNSIYEYLLPGGPIIGSRPLGLDLVPWTDNSIDKFLLPRDLPIGSRTRGPNTVSAKGPKLPGLASTCRSLRNEFLPFYLNRVHIRMRPHSIEGYVHHFQKAFKDLQASLQIVPPDRYLETVVQLMPLLRLSVEAPSVALEFDTFHFSEPGVPAFFSGEVHPRAFFKERSIKGDLSTMIQMGRENKQWAHELLTAIKSVVFYPNGHSLRCRCPLFDVIYDKKHRFCGGKIYSPDDLGPYLRVMGLDAISRSHVRLSAIGHDGRWKHVWTRNHR